MAGLTRSVYSCLQFHDIDGSCWPVCHTDPQFYCLVQSSYLITASSSRPHEMGGIHNCGGPRVRSKESNLHARAHPHGALGLHGVALPDGVAVHDVALRGAKPQDGEFQSVVLPHGEQPHHMVQSDEHLESHDATVVHCGTLGGRCEAFHDELGDQREQPRGAELHHDEGSSHHAEASHGQELHGGATALDEEHHDGQECDVL